jgi:3alpha(or 20beta)-hydroxysteroid dehydrogenase
MGKLDGRVALVTGAARGMGAAHARLLAAEGASVAVCDILADHGTTVAESIGGAYYRLDVTDERDWERVVSGVGSELGPVTILINNAGIGSRNPVQETTTEQWNAVMAVNVTGVFFGIRTVAPVMKAAGGGVIVNVSSDAAFTGTPHIAAYVTSKWAVRGLTKASALDLAGDNIRVVSLHPGLVRTPMSAGVDVDAFASGLPMARPGEPEELAKMMLFIVADATYSTGCEFVADGGHTVGGGRVEVL